MFAFKRIPAAFWAGLAIVGALLYADTERRPHLSAAACGSCHLAASEVKADQASKLVSAQEVLCARCHPKSVRVSHPSGFVPKVKLPPEYPTDWKGDLTCSTCHLVHGRTPGLQRGAVRGRGLCLACHDAAFFAKMKDEGDSIALSGHLDAGIELNSAIELDSYSLQCMGCHGTYGNRRGGLVDRNGIVRHNSGSANHPIGRSYAKAVAYGGYRPESQLSKSVWLPDGKISCVSCHQGYSKDHGKLVTAMSGSALCFECHAL